MLGIANFEVFVQTLIMHVTTKKQVTFLNTFVKHFETGSSECIFNKESERWDRSVL